MKSWMRLALMFVVVVLGGLALLGCGDDKKTSTPKTGTPAQTAAAVDTPSSSDGDASSRLSELQSGLATKELKATYTYTSTSGGTTSQGTFTLYSRPPDWRIDFESEGAGGTLISSGGNSYFCSGEGGEGTCLQSSAFGDTGLPFASYFTEPESLTGLLGSGIGQSTKTVAGEEADCFSGSAEGGEGEVCFNSDGILVSLTSSASGAEFSLEATEISGTVSASDFEPPYDIQTVP